MRLGDGRWIPAFAGMMVRMVYPETPPAVIPAKAGILGLWIIALSLCT